MTRHTFAAGRIPSRAAERSRLVAQVDQARRQYAMRPWDHGTEIALAQAIAAVERFDAPTGPDITADVALAIAEHRRATTKEARPEEPTPERADGTDPAGLETRPKIPGGGS